MTRTPGNNFTSSLKRSQINTRTPGYNFSKLNEESSESINQIKNSRKTDDGSKVDLKDSNLSTSSLNQRRREKLTPNNQIEGKIIINPEKFPTLMKTQINYKKPIPYEINIINNSSNNFPKETFITCIKSNNQDNLFINDTLIKNGEEIQSKEEINVKILMYFKENKIVEGKNCVKLMLKNKNGIINSNEPIVEVNVIDNMKNVVNSQINKNSFKENFYEESSYKLFNSQK